MRVPYDARVTAGTQRTATVADAVGAALAAAGARTVFGVLGSGNLVVTNALVAAGATYHAARHEGGAACMADGWARVTGEVGVVSLHQGPGLTNATTGIAEAAKSGTPLLVLAADTPGAAIHSNFRIDQHDLAAALGAGVERLHGPATAVDDALRALDRAARERRPIVLMLPLDVQAAPAPAEATAPVAPPRPPAPPAPAAAAVAQAAELLRAASRPLIVAGRGAVIADARAALERLADRCGALLATTAPANGLFAGSPWTLGIAGGLASPLAVELFCQTDLVLAFGATLNHWTTRHRTLFGDAPVIQVDVDADVLGAHGPRAISIVGDAAATADALAAALPAPSAEPGWRSAELAGRIATRRWVDEPFEPAAATVDGAAVADPRELTIALERLLPAERAVAVDSGHFLGWPARYLSVPDARAWVFANGFQAVGLGLGCAIGAAVARPDRVTVAAVGDGGLFMALPELETAVRLGLKLLVLIYDDAAYGAEVHHFGPAGHALDGVRFPDADLAALGRAAGARAATVRTVDDLAAVERWLADGAPGPLVVDAKVDPTLRAAWLDDAFRAA